MRIAIDTGGTFTDCVWVERGERGVEVGILGSGELLGGQPKRLPLVSD